MDYLTKSGKIFNKYESYTHDVFEYTDADTTEKSENQDLKKNIQKIGSDFSFR